MQGKIGFFLKGASDKLIKFTSSDWKALFKIDHHFTPEILHRTQESARIYYNTTYFREPRQLTDALTKTPAINIADSVGRFADGTPFPSVPNFFANIPPGHPTFMDPIQRLASGKKVIVSNSLVIASGGYPVTNPRRVKPTPHYAGIFSLAGASFERHYLHPKLFILDPINEIISPQHMASFGHLYRGLPTEFEAAKTVLGKYNSTSDLCRIHTGFPLLARRTRDSFYSSFFIKNAAIFLSEAYSRFLLEDISLLLSAVNEEAKQAGKPALLKATAVGMGFFAKVNGQYDIQHVLYPYYLRAFKKLISENNYPHIAQIEFPTFTDLQSEQFDNIMDNLQINNIRITNTGRDVLEFSPEEVEQFYTCCINPSDTFSWVGNEPDSKSVEAEIGDNTSARADQNALFNPVILDTERHIAVEIDTHTFHAELSEPAWHQSTPKL